ncbi:hypothetical protein [Novosphingobium sp.]|uniref:phage neck terminator protein n=1 Tax=Novosphingobium sp. TaxID=1874826 RepID=UPI00260F5782|nr:hypothetical protein [Novosphingobium sp.]
MSNDSSTGGYLLPTGTAPINDEALDNLFRGVISAVTGLTARNVVRRFNPEPGAPPQFDGTWAAVGVLAIDDDDYPYQALQADDTYKLVQHEVLQVMASFYGAKAQQAARAARNGLQIAQNREALTAAGIVLQDAGRPVRAPEMINSRWANRIDVTFTFKRQTADTFAILPVASVVGSIKNTTGTQLPLNTENPPH